MEIISHTINDRLIGEINSDQIIIRSAQDGLDLLGDLYYQGYEGIILHQDHLVPDFFTLQNGLAGEILQKFSNYRMKLCIIGNLNNVESKSLRDFIYECNKGRQVNFVDSLESALTKLG